MKWAIRQKHNPYLGTLCASILRLALDGRSKWELATTPSEAGGSALAIAFVFGPSGQDCGGIHAGKLL